MNILVVRDSICLTAVLRQQALGREDNSQDAVLEWWYYTLMVIYSLLIFLSGC